MSKNLRAVSRLVGLACIVAIALGVSACSLESSAEREPLRDLQVSFDCIPNDNDESVCTGRFADADFGITAVLRDDIDDLKSAYFVDVGGPFRDQNNVEGAVNAVADLTTAEPHSVIGIFDIPPTLSAHCQESITAFHRLIDVDDANMDDVIALSSKVEEDCNISIRTSEFMFEEASAVSSIVNNLHVGEYQVVGSSFASARWTGIAQLLDPPMLPSRLSFSTPLGYGSDLPQLIQGIESASATFWNEAILDSCSDCSIADLGESVGSRKWARALLGASYAAEGNLKVLPGLVSQTNTQEGVQEFEDTVQRLNEAVLRLDIFDEVQPSWITSLVGICAATTNQSALSGYFQNGLASSAGEGIGMQYLPCTGAEEAASGVRHQDWPQDGRADIPVACLLTVVPDPIVGDGMSYRPAETGGWRDFDYRSPVLRLGNSRHGDLGLAMLGLEQCPPKLSE